VNKISKILNFVIIECYITKWSPPTSFPSERYLQIIFPWRKKGKIRGIMITNFWRWAPEYQTYGLIALVKK